MRIALIKYDVGNWNLKSFSNDPVEHLNAYTNVGKAILITVVDMAAQAATGGGTGLAKSASGLKLAADLGRQIALGGAGGAEAKDRQDATLRDFKARRPTTWKPSKEYGGIPGPGGDGIENR